MSKANATLKHLHELRAEYYRASVGKESLLQLIADAEVAEQVYHSNAIENSTLSLSETEKILLQIDLDRYINERELFEAKNLARVIGYMQLRAKEQELNVPMMRTLHQMLIANIRDDIAGRFRQGNEFVRVANHIAPAPQAVVGLLEAMLLEFHAQPHEGIIRRIARSHLTFEFIHPFVDGNGRIGRVMNNYLLLREGWVPINIKFIDRQKYYNAFAEFEQKGALGIMEDIVAKALSNSYHKRLAYLTGKTIVSLNAYAKANQLSHSNLINKANRQTIPAFLEKGVWKIGAG